jgi:hypothetical protein
MVGVARDLAVEVEVNGAGQTKGLATVGDLDPGEGPWVEAELDLKAPEGGIDLVEVAVQTEGAVLAHGAVHPAEEEAVEIEGCIETSDLV